mmetsp:Transcript_15231/g.25106  ORF Transcript_15231/g.25106 Transcript_15231/m.25106 type:complete len:205 (+) Transcript_15231:194-808(+)|eukprot:CAMPEP_0184656114 /NCGR_PEP_ID=MMETSP0308-20130426/15633_1 /TAXON_ID=38269 /ORGANISM="Gloeochaete witrockiana, Strain SAG 46.84" /LENGTH=204 /DNA_ID=CAMNT_0027093051 /DNA_START=148 /DNA_END=762 /DNA_ORIENTATION=-
MSSMFGWGKSNEEKMFEQVFQLKFVAKQMIKESQRCEKEEKHEKAKLKTAIEKGNMDGARIYAQNAIRKKNEAMNYLRLSSRVDAVQSRLQSAMKMGVVNKNMSGVTKTLASSMEAMDLEKISKTMDTFEKQFEDLDVQSQYVENAISNSTTLSTPEDDVSSLISQVADEHGLKLSEQMQGAPSSAIAEDKELSERLQKLRAAR